MRARKPLTPIQIRKLLLNPCQRDDTALAIRIAGLRAKHADCGKPYCGHKNELSATGMRLLTNCIQSLMGVRR